MADFASMYCRTCLKDLNESHFVKKKPKKHHITSDIADKLSSCTGECVNADDEYPKQLCNSCFQGLNNFETFRIMCVTSKQRFREMLILSAINIKETKTEETNVTSEVESTTFESEIVKEPSGELNTEENPLEIGEEMLKKAIKPHLVAKNENLTEIYSESVESAIKEISEHINLDFKETMKSEGENVEAQCVEKRSKHINTKRKTRQKRLMDNEKQSKPSKIFQCELCSMRFFVEHRFTAHKRTHDGLIPYPCPRDDCDRGFERLHALSEHLKQHEGTNRWFICEEYDCNRRYKHKATLELHLRRYHKKGAELKSFVCEICGKVFKSSAILNDHSFTHKEKSELPFACHHSQCKYRFSNKAKLRVHLMRHAGIKKYICPHCGMRKTTQNELKVHINYHTLERRFPCRFCPQVCNNAGNLKVHVRTVHERAKDYACRFCERTFAKPDTRKYHEMIHTGEKPHECTDCGKRFVQPAALRTHKKIHLRQHSLSEAPAAGKIT